MIRKIFAPLFAVLLAVNIAYAEDALTPAKGVKGNLPVDTEEWVLTTKYYDSYRVTCLFFSGTGVPPDMKCKLSIEDKLGKLQRDPALFAEAWLLAQLAEQTQAGKPQRVNVSKYTRNMYPTRTEVCVEDWVDEVQKVNECGDGMREGMKEAMQKFFPELVPEAAVAARAQRKN